MTILSELPKGWLIMFNELADRQAQADKIALKGEWNQNLAVAWKSLYDVLPGDLLGRVSQAVANDKKLSVWQRAILTDILDRHKTITHN